MTNAEARFNESLRPRKPEGSLGRTAQDVHLDSHTAPELWRRTAGAKQQLLKSSAPGKHQNELVLEDNWISLGVKQIQSKCILYN